MASGIGEREKQLRALREAKASSGGVGVKERPRGSVQKTRTATPSAKGSGPPEKPPVSGVAPAERGDGQLLIRGVTDDLLRRLERARSERGLRSRNDAVLEILEKGAPK